MTEQQHPSAGFASLIEVWTSQLRMITEGMAGMAGLGQSVLPRPLPSLQGLPHPGALSAAQLNLIASNIASQRQSIAAMQAQLKVFDEQLAMLEGVLGPLTEWSNTWAEFEGLMTRARRSTGPEG
jgi:hypothetical protein